uniref:Uncharacterized protein n=1 Tax=Rhizophora mucronata TaxID=61149 RepID=A0A2P2P6V4_RHIMU
MERFRLVKTGWLSQELLENKVSAKGKNQNSIEN